MRESLCGEGKLKVRARDSLCGLAAASPLSHCLFQGSTDCDVEAVIFLELAGVFSVFFVVSLFG